MLNVMKMDTAERGGRGGAESGGKQRVETSQGLLQKIPFALVQTKESPLLAEENTALHSVPVVVVVVVSL